MAREKWAGAVGLAICGNVGGGHSTLYGICLFVFFVWFKGFMLMWCLNWVMPSVKSTTTVSEFVM